MVDHYEGSRTKDKLNVEEHKHVSWYWTHTEHAGKSLGNLTDINKMAGQRNSFVLNNVNYSSLIGNNVRFLTANR